MLAEALRAQFTGPGSGWLVARPSGEGVVLRSANAGVSVRPGLVAVSIGDRRGSAYGATDALLAAIPPDARGSRFAVPHSVLDGLPGGSTSTTVALVVHIAAVLDAVSDEVAIRDRWLAERVGVDPGTVRRHRPMLRSVYDIDRDHTASAWQYKRKGWSDEGGVAWIPSGVLSDLDLRPVDVAVIVGWQSWSGFRGQMNGTWAVVADRARVHPSTVARTVARLRGRGLIVDRRLRVEVLRDPYWRADLRSDLAVAQHRAERRPQPGADARAGARQYSISPSVYQTDTDLSRLQGAVRAQQKNRRRDGRTPRATPVYPKRVHVPDWPVLDALVDCPDWSGPNRGQIRDLARRVGWSAAVAAALECDWRSGTVCPPQYPAAFARAVGCCYCLRCPSPSSHGGECGPEALTAHALRRLDDDRWRIRVRSAGAVLPIPSAYPVAPAARQSDPPARAAEPTRHGGRGRRHTPLRTNGTSPDGAVPYRRMGNTANCGPTKTPGSDLAARRPLRRRPAASPEFTQMRSVGQTPTTGQRWQPG